MSFDLDRRLAAARRRLHARIDARAADAIANLRIAAMNALLDLEVRYQQLRRSAHARKGWVTRRAKGQQ